MINYITRKISGDSRINNSSEIINVNALKILVDTTYKNDYKFISKCNELKINPKIVKFLIA